MPVTALISLVAGILTVLAPCVLPLLPVILGGSVAGAATDRRRPYLITASLVVSLILFTLLLKASTLLINIEPAVWTIVSGGLVVVIGVFMLFPTLWARIATVVGLDRASHTWLGRAFATRNRGLSAVLTGAALGPVFSSCSPTYAWVIATVLPVNLVEGMVYLSCYCIGVGAALLVIALAGRSVLDRVGWTANPTGWLARVVAILFIAVGLSVATGLDRVVQTRLVEADPFGISRLDQGLAPQPPVEQPASGGAAVAAPELVGITGWINSDPLTLAQLRGKVILVDFWTYSCVNCQRTQPYLNAWYRQYADAGLVIVGVHAPEFAFEKVPGNVREAVNRAGITYPVALDNDFKTWNAYGNRFWPAKYLIDTEGRIRYAHFGEGAYEDTEAHIRQLLGGTASLRPPVRVDPAGEQSAQRTPETYLGSDRATNYAGSPALQPSSAEHFTRAPALEADHWTLDGDWAVTGESVRAERDGATLTLRYRGREVFLVMSGPAGSTVQVAVDGQPANGADVGPDGLVHLTTPRLYSLVRQDTDEATLRLTFTTGVTANAFTFG